MAATAKARQICIEEGRPTLIEAMSYRIGAHSTSDDDTKYRTEHAPEEGWDSERAYWEARSPIIRFGRYLNAKGWWNAQMEDHLRVVARREAIDMLNQAQGSDKPAARHLFTDVYDASPWIQVPPALSHLSPCPAFPLYALHCLSASFTASACGGRRRSSSMISERTSKHIGQSTRR